MNFLPLVHAAGPLQAKHKSNQWREIKPVQETNLKYFFQKCTTFFCLKLQPKQNLFPKGHWENFKIGGILKQTKIYIMNKQTFFYVFVYVLGKMKLRVEKKYILFWYTSYLKVSQ